MIGQTIAHYKIFEKLGGGGMGVVYKTHDLNFDRPFALKFLPPELTRDPEARRRLTYEAIPCEDGMASRSREHAAISMTHATTAIRNLTMKRREKAPSDFLA